MAIVRQHFRPEFINRIDETVVFHALGAEHIGGIAALQIERLAQRLAARDIHFVLDNSALAYLAEVGYDAVYGARPLKRAIQQYIENPLAEALLAGTFVAGDTVKGVLIDGAIVFEKTQAKAKTD